MSTEYDAIYRAVYNAIPTTGDLKEVIHHGVQDAFPDGSQILQAIAAGCEVAFESAIPTQGDILEAIQQGVYDAVMSRLSSGAERS